MSYACAICGGNQGSTHTVREMMLGTRKPYEYFWCASCGCFQLTQPTDSATHYPADYVSFQFGRRRRGISALLRRLRNRGVFRGNVFGRVLNLLAPYHAVAADQWLTR